MVKENKAESGKAGEKGRSLRQAGQLEQFFNSRTRLDLNSYVTVTARFVNAAGTPLSRSVLFPALEQTIHRHPALSARLPPPGPELAWIQLDTVDLNRVVTFFDDKGLHDLGPLLQELFARHMEFPEDMPLWRLLVLRDGTVVFAYDHTIGDGLSGLAFHDALLAALKSSPGPSLEHSGLVTSTSQDAAFPPAIEDAMDVSPPLSVVIRAVAKLIFPFLSRTTAAWTGNPVVKDLTMETTVRVFNYSPQDSAALIRLARSHKTTLTGVIHTLGLVVLSRLLRADPVSAKKFKKVPTAIPVSLRKYTGTPPSAICNHVSSYDGTYPLIRDAPATVSVDNFPWKLAASLSARLKREAPKSTPNVGLLKYLGGKYDEFHLGKLGRPRGQGLELSNLGAFPSAPAAPVAAAEKGTDSWRVEETLFAQSDATNGAALKLNACGTGAGGLGLTITWGKGAVDHEFAEDFVKAFGRGLDALLGRIREEA